MDKLREQKLHRLQQQLQRGGAAGIGIMLRAGRWSHEVRWAATTQSHRTGAFSTDPSRTLGDVKPAPSSGKPVLQPLPVRLRAKAPGERAKGGSEQRNKIDEAGAIKLHSAEHGKKVVSSTVSALGAKTVSKQASMSRRSSKKITLTHTKDSKCKRKGRSGKKRRVNKT